MQTTTDSPKTTTAPSVGSGDLLAVCEGVASKLNDAFNLYAWEDSKDRALQIVMDGISPVIAAHQQRHDKAMNYAIALCRAIEHHCAGKQVPDWIAKDCPYHAERLNVIHSANVADEPRSPKHH